MSHKCKICGYIPICPLCGHNPNDEEEEIKPTPEEILEDKKLRHETEEEYRKAYYKKKGWLFKPRPFKE
jgi:hypothetical protein